MEKNLSTLRLILRLVRPLDLLSGAFFFTLGIAIVKYLGGALWWDRLWLTLGMVVMLQLSSYLLKAHFDLLEMATPLRQMQKETPTEEQRAAALLPRNTLLILSITTLTVGALLTVILFNVGGINLLTLVILGIAFLLAFFYAVPPLRLVYSGYGELTEAILIADLIPTLAFLTQTGEVHRFLLVLATPFIALYLAMRIALAFESYARDLKLGRKSLVLRLGWQRAMLFHNLLIPTAYLLIILAGVLGLPWSITWPPLLSLPVGLLQMWLINQIGAGAKPAWGLLRLAAAALVPLAVYLVAFAFFTA